MRNSVIVCRKNKEINDMRTIVLTQQREQDVCRNRNERQRLGFGGLCMGGKALDWWKANKDKYSTWAEEPTRIELYYAKHYRADRAHLEIDELRQTCPVQDYINEIDR